MLPTKLWDGYAAFCLAQHRHYLSFGKSALLHQNLLEHQAGEKSTFEALIPGRITKKYA